VALVAVSLAAGQAGAGGLIMPEVGTADVGLASAGYTARAQDASTVFTNPAGMTRLDGSQLVLGAQLLYGDVIFSIGEGTSTALGSNDGGVAIGWFPGGGLFYSHSLSPSVKVGVAATGNFGLTLKYDDEWVGRYYVQEGTMIGMSLLPAIAVKVSPTLSLGASVNAMYGMLHDQVAVNNLVGADGELTLKASKWGFGGNLGLLWEPGPKTRLGLVWNSELELDFSDRPEWEGLSPAMETLLDSRGLLDAPVDLGVTLPQGVNVSVYQQVTDRWALLGSAGWQEWSKFGQVEVGVRSGDPISLTADLEYKDTWHLAAGAQYRLSEPWLLNFGIAYDSAFQDNPIPVAVPANDAWRIGVGAQKEQSERLSWGVAFECAPAGSTFEVNSTGGPPVALGGRGDLVGAFRDGVIYFIAGNVSWKL
jgi:long-chain fatty acid transport protein